MLLQSQLATKEANPANQRSGGQKGRTCRKCGKGHEGPCQYGSTCFLCGKERHMARYCPKGFQFCFNCNQTGHVKADCPQLASRAV